MITNINNFLITNKTRNKNMSLCLVFYVGAGWRSKLGPSQAFY